jgi:hypothetical protein
MSKLKVIKKTIKTPCWICKGNGCKTCLFTGMWEESINYIIYEKNGQKFCIDSDNIG